MGILRGSESLLRPIAKALLGAACFLFLQAPSPSCNAPPPNSGPCAQQPQQKQGQCYQQCSKAAKKCQASQKKCLANNAKEQATAAKGAANSAGSGAGAGGTQGSGGVQAPNAANMCNGADSNNQRANDLSPNPGLMDECAQAAAECKSAGGDDSATKAGTDASKASQLAEMGKLQQAAQQMQQKCDQSNKNEDKMPSLQMPQMPQQKEDSPAEDPYNNNPWEYPSDTDTNTDTKTNQQIETVKFDDESQNGDVSMLPGAGPSVISGNTSAPTPGFAGGAARSESSGQYGKGIGGNSSGFAAAKGSISAGGSLGGLDSSGSSRPRDGIAGADIAPKNDGSQYEVSAGGKSVLGLKSKSGEDDEVTVADLAGVTSKADGKAGGGKSDRFSVGPLGATGTQGASSAEGGQSVFQMVSHRYRELRKIGEI